MSIHYKKIDYGAAEVGLRPLERLEHFQEKPLVETN